MGEIQPLPRFRYVREFQLPVEKRDSGLLTLWALALHHGESDFTDFGLRWFGGEGVSDTVASVHGDYIYQPSGEMLAKVIHQEFQDHSFTHLVSPCAPERQK